MLGERDSGEWEKKIEKVPEMGIRTSVLDQSVHEKHSGFLFSTQYSLNQRERLNTNIID